MAEKLPLKLVVHISYAVEFIRDGIFLPLKLYINLCIHPTSLKVFLFIYNL